MKIYVGCCGVPGGLKKYSENFKAVELNSTFYKLPKIETVKKWKTIVPLDFNFAVKCHQAITHPTTSPTWRRSGLKEDELKKIKDKVGFLKPTKEVFNFWNKNLEICKTLDAKVCLLQLPASFKDLPENLMNVNKFFSKIKRDSLEIAVELRGWSENNIKSLCKKFSLIHCTDPFVSMPTYFGKNKIAYLRLHGSPPGKQMYRYKYTKDDLLKLKEKIYSLEAKEVFVFFNNIYMKEDAILFKQFLV